jgi:hypothetical protein
MKTNSKNAKFSDCYILNIIFKQFILWIKFREKTYKILDFLFECKLTIFIISINQNLTFIIYNRRIIESLNYFAYFVKNQIVFKYSWLKLIYFFIIINFLNFQNVLNTKFISGRIQSHSIAPSKNFLLIS